MSEYINIPVPSDRVQEIYELLARPKAANPATPASVSTDEAYGAIDPALIKRAYDESPAAMKRALDYLAKHPDEDVPMTDLSAAVGYDPNRMGGALGAFGRRWKHRYHGGNGGSKKPFDQRWDFDRGMNIYSMPSTVAKVLKS